MNIFFFLYSRILRKKGLSKAWLFLSWILLKILSEGHPDVIFKKKKEKKNSSICIFINKNSLFLTGYLLGIYFTFFSFHPDNKQRKCPNPISIVVIKFWKREEGEREGETCKLWQPKSLCTIIQKHTKFVWWIQHATATTPLETNTGMSLL